MMKSLTKLITIATLGMGFCFPAIASFNMYLRVNGEIPPQNTGITLYNTSKQVSREVATTDNSGTFWLPNNTRTEGPSWQGDSITCKDPVFTCSLVQANPGSFLVAYTVSQQKKK